MNEIFFYGMIACLLLFEVFKIGNSRLVYRENKILHDKQEAYHMNLKRREISPFMKYYMAINALYYLYLIIGLFSSQSILFAILLLAKWSVKEKSQISYIVSGIIGFFLLLFIFLNKYIFKINLGW